MVIRQRGIIGDFPVSRLRGVRQELSAWQIFPMAVSSADGLGRCMVLTVQQSFDQERLLVNSTKNILIPPRVLGLVMFALLGVQCCLTQIRQVECNNNYLL